MLDLVLLLSLQQELDDPDSTMLFLRMRLVFKFPMLREDSIVTMFLLLPGLPVLIGDMLRPREVCFWDFSSVLVKFCCDLYFCNSDQAVPSWLLTFACFSASSFYFY